MSDADIRKELLDAIRNLAATAPQMRVGQVLAAVGELCTDMHGRGLWEAEDRELLEAVWRFQRDLQRSAAAAVQPNA